VFQTSDNRYGVTATIATCFLKVQLFSRLSHYRYAKSDDALLIILELDPVLMNTSGVTVDSKTKRCRKKESYGRETQVLL
jgi:hypothetical protein